MKIFSLLDDKKKNISLLLGIIELLICIFLIPINFIFYDPNPSSTLTWITVSLLMISGISMSIYNKFLIIGIGLIAMICFFLLKMQYMF